LHEPLRHIENRNPAVVINRCHGSVIGG
jgi:hypothetical protein